MMKLRFSKNYLIWPAAILTLLMLTSVFGVAFPKVSLENGDALKISPAQPGEDLPDGFSLYQGLSQHGVEIESITPSSGSLVVKLHSPRQQHLAQETLRSLLPRGYSIQPFNSAQPHTWESKITHDQPKVG